MNQKTLTSNHLQFQYLEQGSGKLVICLHGFPDTAETWSHLMPTLANAGYRVVAPFLRGYPPTGIPADGDYSALQLARDVEGILDALGEESAILIGHDWGALATYATANLIPDRIEKMVTLAIPHPRSIKPSLKGLWKSRHFLTFQRRKSAVNKMTKNNASYVDDIYRRWSPTWNFAPEETAKMKALLQQDGVAEAILGYYWSFAENRNNDAIQTLVGKKTAVPTLCLVGGADGALILDAMTDTPDAFTADYQYEIIPDVGHFLHRENPDQIGERILQFLTE